LEFLTIIIIIIEGKNVSLIEIYKIENENHENYEKFTANTMQT